MQHPTRSVAAAAIGLSIAAAASAHEFWIRPATFSPEVGGVFSVSMKHGERFAGSPVPRNRAQIESFTLRGAGSDEPAPVAGLDGRFESLARAEAPGLHTIAHRSTRRPQVLPAERFEDYLREEGLDGVIAQREELGESSMPGREVYVRCATSIVRAGDVPADATAPAAGLPLEICLTTPDGDLDAGAPAAARVVLDGAPLAGVRVVAVHAASPSKLIELTTDERGGVSWTPEAGGPWMLTTIHMRRAEDVDHAEWESLWASLTFEVPRAAGAAAPAAAEAASP